MISLGIMLGIYHSFDDDTSIPNYECQSTFDYFASGYIVLLFATNLLEFLISWLSSKGMVYVLFPKQIQLQLLGGGFKEVIR